MAAIRYLTGDVDRSIAFYRAPRLQARSPGSSGGPRGKQIQLEDPDGNPIELFQSA
jgi:hypothetical protein